MIETHLVAVQLKVCIDVDGQNALHISDAAILREQAEAQVKFADLLMGRSTFHHRPDDLCLDDCCGVAFVLRRKVPRKMFAYYS